MTLLSYIWYTSETILGILVAKHVFIERVIHHFSKNTMSLNLYKLSIEIVGWGLGWEAGGSRALDYKVGEE